MPRYFNTAGPCRADLHYMLPPERRVGGLHTLIDQELYFILHAPRQVGKTTSLLALAERLTAEGRYTALLTTCEVGQKLVPDLEGSMAAILSLLQQQARIRLPEPLQPPATDASQPPESRLNDLLERWAQRSPRPVVLFLDEIDALQDDVLISVLRSCAPAYPLVPTTFPQLHRARRLRDV
ncbi:MAG: ATP-binding protein, partial [Thermoanaerobaculia bacterium]|nr:ATP-binding protein [Thermoanaerobaculia bacterium]